MVKYCRLLKHSTGLGKEDSGMSLSGYVFVSTLLKVGEMLCFHTWAAAIFIAAVTITTAAAETSTVAFPH